VKDMTIICPPIAAMLYGADPRDPASPWKLTEHERKIACEIYDATRLWHREWPDFDAGQDTLHWRLQQVATWAPVLRLAAGSCHWDLDKSEPVLTAGGLYGDKAAGPVFGNALSALYAVASTGESWYGCFIEFAGDLQHNSDLAACEKQALVHLEARYTNFAGQLAEAEKLLTGLCGEASAFLENISYY